ncbi:MAG: sigma-70 family RNA polymerase sigma factor [Patescibacteria group bacterium]
MNLSEKEIQNLILQAQQGDQSSFTQIYNLFFERVYKFIFFRTKIREEAEDLTSRVFLKVWQNLTKYKEQKTAKFSTWLFQIARFTVIDYYRQAKTKVSLTEVENYIGSEFNQAEQEIAEVKRSIHNLPVEWQNIITLRYFDGLDYAQIAKITGKTAVGVRVIAHRAIKRLGKLLKIYE